MVLSIVPRLTVMMGKTDQLMLPTLGMVEYLVDLNSETNHFLWFFELLISFILFCPFSQFNYELQIIIIFSLLSIFFQVIM